MFAEIEDKKITNGIFIFYSSVQKQTKTTLDTRFGEQSLTI